MRRGWLLVAAVVALASSMFADQIVMKNGDRLTGTIVKSDGKVLVIKTDYAGEVTVKFDAIQSINAPGEMHVGLRNGKTVVGSVTTDGDNLIVTTKTAGPVVEAKSGITMLRSPAEQAAYEKILHPGWDEGWKGGLNLGFAVTRGNSETKNLNIAFNAVRTGFHDKLTLYTNSIYATNDLPTASPHITSNSIGGGARYDHNFSPRAFGFVSGDFLSNSLQYLSLRSTLSGGIGMHAIKNATTTFDLLAGVNYTHEGYSDVPIPPVPPSTTGTFESYSNNLVGLTLGDAFTQKAGKGTVITQSFFFYPDLSNTSQYRGTFNFSTVTKLKKWLGWQNSFGDIYVSNPPSGTKQNDLQLTTGVSFTFTH